MTTGDIVIVSFPFADMVTFKARPAIVVAETADKHKDVVVSLVSSVVPLQPNLHQIIVQPSAINNLQAESVIKVSRLATIEKTKIVAVIGKLDKIHLDKFIDLFISLVKK